LVCRLCGAASPLQQTSCAVCGSPLEPPPARRTPRAHAQPSVGWAIWMLVCSVFGAAVGVLVAKAYPAARSATDHSAALAAVTGGVLGAALGSIPGPTAKALAAGWGRLGVQAYGWLSRRLLRRIRKGCERALEEGDEEAGARLAAALWLQGERDRAEQILSQVLEAQASRLPGVETVGASALARHNLAVVAAASGRLTRALGELGQARGELGRSGRLLWNHGIACWKLRRFEQAAGAFADLVDVLPDDLGARNALALSRAQCGEVQEAIAELEKALGRDRHDPDTLCNLGLLHQSRGSAGAAEQCLTSALQRFPRHVPSRYNRGVCAMARGWYQSAIDDFAAATRAAPAYARGHVQEAICWHRLGRSARALEGARRALRHGADDFQVLYNGGTLLLREQPVDPALRELEKAYELDPESVDVIVNLGVACYLAGRSRRALDHFRAAVRMDPRHANARYDCAVAYNMAEMYGEAESQLEELLAAYPEFPEAFNAIGAVRLLQGRLVEAAAQLRRAADAMPRSAIARSNLGLTYYLQGDLAAAGEQVRYAAALDPTLAAAQDLAGHVAMDLNEVLSAIEYFSALAKLEPSNADAHSNLGLAYYRDDRLNEAVESFRRALVFAPHSPEGHNDLGIAYAKNKMLGEAARHLTQVADWRPSDPVARSNLGLVYYFQAESEKAVENWREVTRISPAYARSREATRFSAYDDQEMVLRPLHPRKRVCQYPLKVCGFRQSYQVALKEDDYRMELPWPDLATAEKWKRRASELRERFGKG
jgi:tetratricopeptide (TPR) repeat protein